MFHTYSFLFWAKLKYSEENLKNEDSGNLAGVRSINDNGIIEIGEQRIWKFFEFGHSFPSRGIHTLDFSIKTTNAVLSDLRIVDVVK